MTKINYVYVTYYNQSLHKLAAECVIDSRKRKQ